MSMRVPDQSMPEQLPPGADPLFDGPGEMRALCRAFDWSTTPLGPSEQWPVSLRTVVGMLLASRNPMFLWWGPELIQIYNDAYRPSLGAAGVDGARHPRALGMGGREFWTDIWEAIGPQIEQVLTTGEPTWHVDQYLPIERDGRMDDVWWTYGYSAAYDDDGRIAGVLVVCQETTQRVRAEQERERLLEELFRNERALKRERARLAEVFRQAPSFLAVLRGTDHVFELVNDAYYDIVGDRDLVGRRVLDAIPELEGQPFISLLDQVSETGEPYVGHEVPVRLARTRGTDPELRYIDFVYQPLTEEGGVTGIIAHGHDVTEQVLSRQQVERLLVESEAARAEAEEANHAKARFLATMSHELRTPLNAIAGYAELLQMGVRGELSDAQRDFLGRIQQSQRHLLGLINEVLHFARLETGTVHFQIDGVPIQATLAAAEALVAPQARAKGLTLKLAECPAALFAQADAEKVRQILVNLLSNAVKFTPAGGRVDVVAERRGSDVAIEVRDTGIGIPPEEITTIFEPFVQVHSDLTRPYEGTGLGLAISRDLARAMGGDLTVDSRPGTGSTFLLLLPATGAPS
jgi:signal transduction histidine kinase